MNSTLETIHGLRTIHGNFRDEKIPEETVDTILQAAMRAANASNRQSYSIIVTDDLGKMFGVKASHMLLFCVDYNRIIDVARHLGCEFHTGQTVHLITGSTDTILAAQTACIAAKSLGIDSLFTNNIHRGDIGRVYRIFELPLDHCFPLIALYLGYPHKEPRHQRGRWFGAGQIHRDSYRRASKTELDEIVAQYDDPANHIGLVEAKTWGKEHQHYLEWFYKVWSARSGTPETPSQMHCILAAAGLLERGNPNG